MAKRALKCTEEHLQSALPPPTLNSLCKIFMGSKGKGMEKFDCVKTRCNDVKLLPRDMCERLFQTLVLERYLDEIPKVNELKYNDFHVSSKQCVDERLGIFS